MRVQGLYNEMKFERPSRVQAETLPMILNPPYRNLVAQAHNGSGKTTCFVLALLGRVDVSVAQPQCLCMCPTRELVVQNMQVSPPAERLYRDPGWTTQSADASWLTIQLDCCSCSAIVPPCELPHI